MITFSHCRRLDLNKLIYNINQFRTQQKDYLDDELFLTDDEKYLILCHTIREGSMNAYYTQIVIFKNDEAQSIRMNINKSWSPLWMHNFHYLPNTEEVIYSLTCYDSETRKNPTPTLIVNLKFSKIAILPKETDYSKLGEVEKDRLNWSEILENKDLCKEFKKEYAL